MSKIVPFKNAFDKAKKFDTWSNRLAWISAILFSIVFVLKYFSNSTTIQCIIDTVDKVNCIIIFMCFVFGFVTDWIHSNAETYRRTDFVDDAFGCKLAENRSVEYYTNNELKNGLYKMSVDSFESCFFSYKIASKLQCWLWCKSAVFVILFIICAVFGYDKGIIFIIQLSLPLSIILHTIKHQRFVSHLKTIYDNYRSIFDSLRYKQGISQNDYAKLTKEILEYEGTISYANILLNEKIYNEMNKALSEEWNSIKLDYKIVPLFYCK